MLVWDSGFTLASCYSAESGARPAKLQTGLRHEAVGSGSLWAHERSNASGRQCGHEGTASYGDAGLLRQIQTG